MCGKIVPLRNGLYQDSIEFWVMPLYSVFDCILRPAVACRAARIRRVADMPCLLPSLRGRRLNLYFLIFFSFQERPLVQKMESFKWENSIPLLKSAMRWELLWLSALKKRKMPRRSTFACLRVTLNERIFFLLWLHIFLYLFSPVAF